MSTTSKLEKDISDIEGHYYKCARRIRELLFDDSYKELGVYLNKHSDSLKNDLDLAGNRSDGAAFRAHAATLAFFQYNIYTNTKPLPPQSYGVYGEVFL